MDSGIKRWSTHSRCSPSLLRRMHAMQAVRDHFPSATCLVAVGCCYREEGRQAGSVADWSSDQV